MNPIIIACICATIKLMLQLTKLKGINIVKYFTLFTALCNLLAFLFLKLKYYADSCDFINNNKYILRNDGTARFVLNGSTYTSYTWILGELKIKVRRITDRLTRSEVKYYEEFKENYDNIHVTILLEVFILFVCGFSYREISQHMRLVHGRKKGFSTKNIGNLVQKFIDKYYADDTFYECILPQKYMAMYLDATFIKTRGGIKTCILAAVAITSEGKYKLLNLKKALDNSETEASYIDLLNGLKDKGLEIPEMIVADGATAIWAAVTKVFPNSLKQACWIHKCRNVFNAINKNRWKVVGEKLKLIFDAETEEEANYMLDKLIAEEFEKSPKVKKILTDNRDMLFNYFKFPKSYRKSLYTSNPVETVFSLMKTRAKSTRGMMNENKMLFIFNLIGTQCNNDKSLVENIIGNYENVRNQMDAEAETKYDSAMDTKIYDLVLNNDNIAESKDILVKIATQLMDPGLDVYNNFFTEYTDDSFDPFVTICNTIVKDNTTSKNKKDDDLLKKISDDIQTTEKNSKKPDTNNDTKQGKDKKDIATEASNKKPSEDKAKQTEKNKEESSQVKECISVCDIQNHFLMNILKSNQNLPELIDTKNDDKTIKKLRNLIKKRKKYLFNNKDFITETDDWYYIKKIE
jgi:transposase-like protein